MFYVYVLESLKDKGFYIGFTADLKKRFISHNKGFSNATKWRRPFTLIYYEASLNKSDALHREIYLKTAWGRRYVKNRIKCYKATVR